MNPRITLVIVAAFALLLGYVFFVEMPRGPGESGTPPRPAPRVFTLPPGEVKSVELRDLLNARFVKITRVDNKWQVEKPETRAGDTAKIDPLIDGLAVLQASRVLTDVTNLTQFGVLTPIMEVRMIMRDSTAYALSIGHKSPDGQGFYAIYPGDPSKLFIIQTAMIGEFQIWFSLPPYEPTATPTFTPTPPVTPTTSGTPTTGASPTQLPTTPTAAPPAFVPTLLPSPVPTATAVPTPTPSARDYGG